MHDGDYTYICLPILQCVGYENTRGSGSAPRFPLLGLRACDRTLSCWLLGHEKSFSKCIESLFSVNSKNATVDNPFDGDLYARNIVLCLDVGACLKVNT